MKGGGEQLVRLMLITYLYSSTEVRNMTSILPRTLYQNTSSWTLGVVWKRLPLLAVLVVFFLQLSSLTPLQLYFSFFDCIEKVCVCVCDKYFDWCARTHTALPVMSSSQHHMYKLDYILSTRHQRQIKAKNHGRMAVVQCLFYMTNVFVNKNNNKQTTTHSHVHAF